MNDHLRVIAELDRVIHEPERMMIVALLAAVEQLKIELEKTKSAKFKSGPG